MRVISIDGGAARSVPVKLHAGVIPADWTPDGKTVVAYWREGDGTWKGITSQGMATVDLTTGEQKRLVSCDASPVPTSKCKVRGTSRSLASLRMGAGLRTPGPRLRDSSKSLLWTGKPVKRPSWFHECPGTANRCGRRAVTESYFGATTTERAASGWWAFNPGSRPAHPSWSGTTWAKLTGRGSAATERFSTRSGSRGAIYTRPQSIRRPCKSPAPQPRSATPAREGPTVLPGRRAATCGPISS